MDQTDHFRIPLTRQPKGHSICLAVRSRLCRGSNEVMLGKVCDSWSSAASLEFSWFESSLLFRRIHSTQCLLWSCHCSGELAHASSQNDKDTLHHLQICVIRDPHRDNSFAPRIRYDCSMHHVSPVTTALRLCKYENSFS